MNRSKTLHPLAILLFVLSACNLPSTDATQTSQDQLNTVVAAIAVELPTATSYTPPTSTSAPQNGAVSGRICYPSEQIPAMTAYFQNANSKVIYDLDISVNQSSYQRELPPGVYIAFAWLPDYSIGGSYSAAVPCGLSVSCTDHTPLTFFVSGGMTTSNIDICDWYSQEDVPSVPNKG